MMNSSVKRVLARSTFNGTQVFPLLYAIHQFYRKGSVDRIRNLRSPLLRCDYWIRDIIADYCVHAYPHRFPGYHVFQLHLGGQEVPSHTGITVWLMSTGFDSRFTW